MTCDLQVTRWHQVLLITGHTYTEQTGTCEPIASKIKPSFIYLLVKQALCSVKASAKIQTVDQTSTHWSSETSQKYVPGFQGLLPRGERPNPLREKNAAVNGLLHSWLPRLGQAQLLDVSGGFVHSDGAISHQDMFDFLHLTSTGYRTMSKPLSDLLLQILEEMPGGRRASLVWGSQPSSMFIQRHVSLAPVEDAGDMSLVCGGRMGSLIGEWGTLMWVDTQGVWDDIHKWRFECGGLLQRESERALTSLQM